MIRFDIIIRHFTFLEFFIFTSIKHWINRFFQTLKKNFSFLLGKNKFLLKFSNIIFNDN